ncbi:MAG: TerC family protein, partial [Phenylobacterium sp.]|nr:TerC family protein [Phenylobacterium sp.]
MDALLLFFQTPFLGQATWLWLLFLGIVLTVLTLDLGVFNRKDHIIGPGESVKAASAYIALGLSFGAWIWYDLGSQKAVEYYTGYLLELTLALDNVFVISLILAYFAVPRELQHRVLFWGILGVIVLRAIMIGIGAALVTNFAWVLYIFAAFLLFTGAKMLKESFSSDAEEAKDLTNNAILKWLRSRLRVTESFQGSKFFVRQAHPVSGKLVLFATPLFLALVLVEFADLVFAIDSVPAIFAITQDPYIVYTSNIFAILGLRALYFALAAAMNRFRYLQTSLAIILVLVGIKIFLVPMGIKIDTLLSLLVTVGILAGGVIFSLW